MKKRIIFVCCFLIALLCMTVFFTSCGEKEEKVIARDISEESSLASTIVNANASKNAVQCYYGDSSRKNFFVENLNSKYEICFGYSKKPGIVKISTASGKVLFEGCGVGFVETDDGCYYSTNSTLSSARVNTNRMGYYYYQVAVRDLGLYLDGSKSTSYGNLNCGYEQTLHTYSDKVHNESRLIFDKTTSNVTKFGNTYTIPKNTVSNYELNEEEGYVGFQIKKAGVLGFIVPSNDGSTKLELIEEESNYIVNIYRDIKGSREKNTYIQISHRIFTSEDSDFTNLKEQAYCERNPLTLKVSKQANKVSYFNYSGYNNIKGCYEFTVSGTGFHAWNDASLYNVNYGGEIQATGDDYNRTIYICTVTTSGSLEGAALLDENGILIPVAPEVCKNFGGEFEEKYYEPYDSAYGNAIYPFVVEKNTTTKHTILNVYNKWGKFDLKQISSISFHIGYYHLSTGMTESNCIAPYFVYGRDGWTLPDFRGCSGKMWSGQPQYNSVGRLRFVSYIDDDNVEHVSEYTGSDIKSSGLTYADIDYSYTADNGAYEYTLSHIEYPQKDENRTYYTLNLKFNKNLTVSSVRDLFTIFSFDGRYGYFEKTSYLDENGERQTFTNDTDTDEDIVTIYKLNKGSSYVSYYKFSAGAVENFALIIRDYDIKIGGKAFDGNLCFRNSNYIDATYTTLNLFELTLDEGKVKFKKGDYITINMVLLPFGTANQKNDTNATTVYEDSALKPLTVSSVAVGTVIDDPWLAIVKAQNNVAEFTVTGSRDVNVVTVEGFEHIAQPKLYEKIDGEWEEVKLISKNGYDGYQIAYTEDGFFSYSFCFKQASPDDVHEFRLTVDNS